MKDNKSSKHDTSCAAWMHWKLTLLLTGFSFMF